MFRELGNSVRIRIVQNSPISSQIRLSKVMTASHLARIGHDGGAELQGCGASPTAGGNVAAGGGILFCSVPSIWGFHTWGYP